MTTPPNMHKLAAEPLAFVEILTIPSAHGSRRFGDVMAEFQRRDFQSLAPALVALRANAKPSPSRFWLERTKGASKDSDLACCLLWALAFCARPLTIQVGAADQDQADELRKAAKAVLRLNPWLSKLLIVQALSIVNPHTESRADIIPADTMGSHGSRPDVLILNELTHVSNREFAETLLDNASKMPSGVVIIATNAGHRETWQEQWRQTAIESDRWHFSNYTDPAPWLDPAELSEAQRRNSPNRFARLWQGQWVSESGDALNPADIDAAVNPALAELTAPEKGYRYALGVDLSLTRDHSSVVLAGRFVGDVRIVTQRRKHPIGGPLVRAGIIDDPNERQIARRINGDGSYRLGRVRSWKPTPGNRINLERVERHVRKLAERFDADILLDAYQAASIHERLTRDGYRAELVQFTAPVLAGMTQTILGGFADGAIRLYPHAELVSQLHALRCEEKSYGTRLVSPRTKAGGHGDIASAFGLAIFGLSRDDRETGDWDALDPDDSLVY